LDYSSGVAGAGLLLLGLLVVVGHRRRPVV
jgi:MYXO-CTERM domain-containing protein